MLKVGLLGAGHLGKIHLRLLGESPHYELVGFYDPDPETAAAVETKTGVKSFSDPDNLLEQVDVADIVSPTLYHFGCARRAIERGCHVFLEKPVTATLEEARELIRLLDEKGHKGQVGHVERFNPAFTAVRPHIKEPAFIESHRLAEFNPRGTDVPVVLDLMIHDIDAILTLVGSPVKAISASGACVVNPTPDIANARIEFENGCVANITTSRISMKNMRKTRVFQRDAYITINFLKKEAEILRMSDAPPHPDDYAMILTNAVGESKQIVFEKPPIQENNAILDELNTFAQAIENNTTPLVTLAQGAAALEVALDIVADIDRHLKRVTHAGK